MTNVDVTMVSVTCTCGGDAVIMTSDRVAIKWPRCPCGKMMKVEKNANPPVQNGIRMVRPRQSSRPVGRT